MKLIRIYNILFAIYFFSALYGFVYERYLHDVTYVQYAMSYTDGFPQYSIYEPQPECIPSIYDVYEIPLLYEISHRAFEFVFWVTLLVFIPMLGSGIFLFVLMEMHSHYKWWIIQLVGFSCIAYFAIDMLNFVYD